PIGWMPGARHIDSAWHKPGCSTRPLMRHIFAAGSTDRKSTRLNSSHVSISYAVFCLKKKKAQELLPGLRYTYGQAQAIEDLIETKVERQKNKSTVFRKNIQLADIQATELTSYLRGNT